MLSYLPYCLERDSLSHNYMYVLIIINEIENKAGCV